MRKRREWFMIFLILPMVSAQYDLKNDLYGAERISFNPVPPPVVRQPPPPPPQHQGNARGYQAPPHAAFFQPPRSYSNSYLTNNYVPSNVQRPSGFRPPLLQPHSSANFAPPKHNLPHLNMIPEVFNDWRMAQLHEQHPQRFTNLANHDVHQQSNVLKQIRKSSEAVRRPVFTNAKPEYQESDLTPNHYVSDSSILSSTPSTQPTTTTSATTTTSKRASVVYESDFYNDRRIPSSPPASQPTQTSFETPYQASETATRKVSTVSHSNYPAQTTSRKPYIEPESYSRTDDYEASPIYQTTGAFDSKRVSTQYLSTSTRYPSYETENTQFKARVTTTNALRTAIGVRVPVQNPKTIAHSEPASYDGSQSYNNQVITNTLQQTTQQPTERYTQKTPSSNSRPSISLSEGTQALVSISQKQVNNRAGPPAPPPVRNNGNSWTTTKAPNSPIVVGTRVGQNRNHQNLGSSNTISNANEVNNIIVHIFLNAKDNKHPGAHASTKLGPFHGTFGVGTSHGGPGTNANPIVITKDFDRDRLRFIDSQTAENMMESGPTNIVEVKAMVSSPDQQIGSTLNRAVSTELDRAIPVVLNRFKGPASGMDGELRKELEQALVDEIAKNLGQTIDDISTDVTEDDLTQLIEEGLKEFESEKNEAPTSTSLPTVSSSITEETPSFTTTTRIIVTTSAPALTSTTRRIVTTTTHTTTTPTTTTSKPTPTTTTTTTRVPTTTESTTTTTTTVSSTTQTKPTTTTRSTTTTTVPTTTTTTMTRLQPVTTTSSVPRTSSALPSKPQSTTTEPKKATIDFDMENEVGVHNVDSAQPKQELEPMTKSKEEPTPPTDIDDDYDSTETDIVHNPEDDVDELPSDGQRTTQLQSELRTTSTIAESALENADASRASSARTTIQTASTASTTPSLNLLPPATTSQENINNSDEIFETSHQPKLSIVDLSEPDDDTELTSHSTQSTATGHTRADLITLTASTMSMEDIPLKTSTTPPITKNTVVPPDETSPFDANSDTFKINETASKASPAIQTSTSKINVVDSSSEEVLAHMPDLTKPIIDEPSSSEAEHEPFKHNMPFEPSQATDSAQAPENSEKENFEMFETTTLTNGGDVQMQPESVVFPQGQCPTPNNLKDQNRTDVLFLLDSSNSFDEDKFMHAITLILHTVDYFQNIGPDGVQFSLVQYNSEPYLEFSLRKHNCKQWLLDDIADTEYMTGKSMLGKALDKVSKFAFTKKRGDRLDAENVLIILTGGESDDRVQQPVKIAKQNNMTVLVIATLETDPSYLLNLAGDTENVFQLDDSPNAPLAGKLAERIKASSTNGKNTVAVSDNIDQMEIHQPVKPVDINDLSDEKDEVTVTSQPILVNKESNEDRLIKMECAPDGFQIDLNLPASFLGHVVVKGQEKKENCRKVILPLAHNSGNQTVSFFVANEDCEVQQVKSTKPEGMNSTMVLHLVHDPSLRTDKDRAYLLQCFVGTGETSEAEVSTNLDVLKNDITIAETISLSSVPPTCSYSIRKNSPDGPTISKATVGQTVYHRWECDGGDEANHVYGIQVHNCYASDDIEQKYPIVDNRGCSSDLAVLSDPFYEDEKLVAFAVSHAFGFKDTESLKFVCKLSLCTRDGDGCEGVTPPVCGKSQNQSDLLLTRRSRHQYSAIEKALTSALSTEVDLTTRGAEIRDRITGLATSHITLGVTALLIVALIVTGVVSKLYSPRSRVSSSSFSTADDESEIGFSPASSPQLTLRLPAGNSSSSVEPAADPRLVEFLRDFDRQRYV